MSLSLRETEERTSFPLFGIIIPHLDRCRSLALTISYAVLSELADSHRDFQHLEELHLILALPPYRRSPRRTFDVSRSAPLLSRFTASFRDDFDSLDAYVRINWSKLTHLTLECIPFHRVYSILQNTPALQAFRLIDKPNQDPSHNFDLKGPVIRLNHLTTLTFERLQPTDMLGIEFWRQQPAQLLDRFALPSLSTLLSNFIGDCDTYISLVHRSQCCITHLRVALVSCSPEKMLQLLGAVPTVRVLEVLMDNLPSILHSMESLLSTPIQPPFILPSLQHLKLLTQTNDGIPDNLKDMLEQFIRSRTEDLLSRILGDHHDSVKFQLLGHVSLYLPMVPSFKSQVFWHFTGRPRDMNEDTLCHEVAIWRTNLNSLVDLRTVGFQGVKARLEELMAMEDVHNSDPGMCCNLPMIGLNIKRMLVWLPRRFPQQSETRALMRRLQAFDQRCTSAIDQLSSGWIFTLDGVLTYSTGYSLRE